MPTSDGGSSAMSQPEKPPLRTRLFVWLSVLAVMGAMMIVCGAVLAWLIIEMLPADQ